MHLSIVHHDCITIPSLIPLYSDIVCAYVFFRVGGISIYAFITGLEQAFWSTKYATIMGGILSPGPQWPLPSVFIARVSAWALLYGIVVAIGLMFLWYL